MNPLRILILAVLIYLVFRIIFGGRRRENENAPGAREEGGKNNAVNDLLVEDPTCGRLVPKKQAVRFEHGGEIHYFCSKECCNLFRKKQGDGL